MMADKVSYEDVLNAALPIQCPIEMIFGSDALAKYITGDENAVAGRYILDSTNGIWKFKQSIPEILKQFNE